MHELANSLGRAWASRCRISVPRVEHITEVHVDQWISAFLIAKLRIIKKPWQQYTLTCSWWASGVVFYSLKKNTLITIQTNHPEIMSAIGSTLYPQRNDSTNRCRAYHLRNPQHHTHLLNSLVGLRRRNVGQHKNYSCRFPDCNTPLSHQINIDGVQQCNWYKWWNRDAKTLEKHWLLMLWSQISSWSE